MLRPLRGLLGIGLALCISSPAFAQSVPASPAAMISDFRLQHGEGRVTSDAKLKRIAQEQADAMASKGVMDHDVLGPFNSRVSSAGAQHAAENIAYGNDGFAKTLDQWINSAGHRKNLLMHNASRVGVASARSPINGRSYWAMVIAGGYEKPKPPGGKPATAEKSTGRKQQACRLRVLGLCL